MEGEKRGGREGRKEGRRNRGREGRSRWRKRRELLNSLDISPGCNTYVRHTE